MAETFANLSTANTFLEWLTRTNQLSDVLTLRTVTTKANTAGATVTGNGAILGTFTANTLHVTTGLKGGGQGTDAVVNVLSNTNIKGTTANISANVAFSGNVDFSSAGDVLLGTVGQVRITGGTSGGFYRTDGTGTTFWDTKMQQVGDHLEFNANTIYNNTTTTINANTILNGTLGGSTLSVSANVNFTGNVVMNAASNVQLGAIGNIHITGGSQDQALTTDGSGVHSWTSIASTTANVNFTGANTAISGGEFNVTSNTVLNADATLSAISGIIESNTVIVDGVIFGPALDPVDWSDKTSATTASLMFATVKDNGADSVIEIWDITTPSIIGGSAIATVTITGAATPTSIAAAMGYIIVGSEDGVTIIDPHDGSWAERTVGWPKSLSTSTTPALTDNDIQDVAAGVSDQPVHDPRTGGPMPCFGVGYGTGADIVSLIKDDGNVWDRSGTVGGDVGVAIHDGQLIFADGVAQQALNVSSPISAITADDFTRDKYQTGGNPQVFGPDNEIDAARGLVAVASTSGLSLAEKSAAGVASAANPDVLTSLVNRTYNTGYMIGDIRIAALANSATTDRSYKANTLTENGTVTEAAVESGAELNGYSGFSDSTNYLTRAYDADFDFGTGDFCAMFWVKRTGTSGTQTAWSRKTSGGSNIICQLASGANTIRQFIGDGSNSADNSGVALPDSEWAFVVITWDGTAGVNKIFVNGRLGGTATNASVGSLNNGTAVLSLGSSYDGSEACDQASLSLFRLSATRPNDAQIRAIYEAERGMFAANAKCLLQSGTTDAVLDVSVDPITGKVAVTQTDDLTIWDGLVVDSEPAIATGGTTWEHNLLYGGDRVEINDANLYATVAAKDLRGDLELVRALANGLHVGQAYDAELFTARKGRRLNINGAMAVAQKGTSFAGEDGASATSNRLDMWRLSRLSGTEAGRFTITQENSRGPAGFPYWLKCLVTTAESAIAAGEGMVIETQVEARDLQRLNYGDADAVDLTLQAKMIVHAAAGSALTFPVTAGLFLYSPDGTRSFVHAASIAAADTWTDVSFKIDGDTAGTINNDNGTGFQVGIVLYAGSNYQVTGDQWAAGNDRTTSAQDNLADATNNYVGITGVQLEPGDVATDFDHWPFDVELDRAQFYFERKDYSSSSGEAVCEIYAYSSTTLQGHLDYRRKRDTPTLSATAAGTFKGRTAGGSLTAGTSGPSFANVGFERCLFQLTISGYGATAGHGGEVRRDGSDTAYVDVEAELQ